MNALIPFAGNGMPPARRSLIDLNAKIADAEKRLDVLQAGKARLEAELARASDAKAELAALVDDDARSLLDRVRSGGQWLLSSFGSHRARELAAQLSASRIEASIGEKALASIAEEEADLERQISELKARRPDAINAVLIEVADGFRTDLLLAIDDLKNSLVILAGMDSVVARGDGSYAPDKRLVIEIPSAGGLAAQPLIAPAASIKNAESIWREFAADLARDPLADVEALKFPHVHGNEDSGNVVYSSLSRVERQIVDSEHAQGAH
jgi:cell division protein FtsB